MRLLCCGTVTDESPLGEVVECGLEEVVLRLDGENGGRLRESRSKGRGSRWRDVFDQPPGRYVLGVMGRPAWKCDITIAAR